MAQYTTDGIVIGGIKFGEADRILRILTRERGRISAMAKGVRRAKSKFSGCLEPMMVNAFLFAEGRNMDTVCQAENIRSYSKIRSSYDLLCSAGSLLEAAGQLTEEGLPDLMTYELLLGALDALDAGSSSALVELIFKTGLLLGHGIFPDMSGCNTCGKTRTRTIHFDSVRMSFICDDCAKTQGIYHSIPRKTLEGLHWASRCGVDAEKEISKIFIETNPPRNVMDNVDDAVKLADEMLSAFLQKGLGKFRKHNKSTGNT